VLCEQLAVHTAAGDAATVDQMPGTGDVRHYTLKEQPRLLHEPQCTPVEWAQSRTWAQAQA
jgi:hypothetical protein